MSIGIMSATGVSANNISDARAPGQVVRNVNESSINAKVIDRQDTIVPNARGMVQTASAEQIKNTL